MTSDGPLDSLYKESKPNAIREEYTVYVVERGMLTKKTAVRTWTDKGDYNDSTHFIPLIEVKNDDIK